VSENTLRYQFRFPDGNEAFFEVPIEGEEAAGGLGDLPEWTKLEFHQCPNCPLAPETTPVCPLAESISGLVQRFESVLSYDQVTVEVEHGSCRVSGHVTAQQGLSALMGLVMSTSGCPHTEFFRPMARYHLPLASQDDTIYRAASMYMLAQYFRVKAGKDPDFSFEGLGRIYRNIQEVNRAMAARVRAAISHDAAVNAIVVLDFFAQSLPFAIEDELVDLSEVFTPYLEDGPVSDASE